GQSVSVQVVATDVNSKTVFSASGLPAGLAIDKATGVISGTIAAGANRTAPYTVTVTVTDKGITKTETFHWTVNPAVTIEPISDQTSTDGQASVSLQVHASDGPAKPLIYQETGLPPGLSIDANGLISGTIAGDADAHSPY